MMLNSKEFKFLFSILCACAGVAVMFILENYGDLTRDEAFQTLCVKNYKEAPLGLLTFWIGHIWCDIFGFSILNLRILASVEGLLSITLTSFFAYRLTRNTNLTSVLFLLGCVLLRISNFCIYNWDSGIFVFEAFSLCLLVSYLSNPSLIKCFFLGCGCAFMTLGRLPSIIFVFFSLLIIWVSLHEKRLKIKMFSTGAVIIGFLICFSLLTFIILGSPFEYLKALNSGYVIDGHSPAKDFIRLFYRFKDKVTALPLIWSFGCGCIFISIIIPKIKRILNIWIIIISWIIFCSCLTYLMSKNIYTVNLILGLDTPLGIGLLLSLPIFLKFTNRVEPYPNEKLMLWACGLMMVSLAFGSDAYFERMNCAFIIPIIIAILWVNKSSGLHKYLKTCCLISLISFSSILSVHFLSLYIRMGKNSYSIDSGLFKDIKLTEFIYNEIQSPKEAISLLRKSRRPYIYVGDHLFSELAYGPDEGPSFNRYHFNIAFYSDWKKYETEPDNKIEQIDAFVYGIGISSHNIEKVIEEIRQKGFTKEQKIGNAVILYRDSK